MENEILVNILMICCSVSARLLWCGLQATVQRKL